MPKDYDERTTPTLQHRDTSSDQFRTDSLTLILGSHCHRRESHPSGSSIFAFDYDRTEENVADNLILSHSHQREQVTAILSQLVNDISLFGSVECLYVHQTDCIDVLRQFLPNRSHVLHPTMRACCREQICTLRAARLVRTHKTATLREI
jgi:hypothetical protein